jgi:C-terminal processing protease CtpA/Prc
MCSVSSDLMVKLEPQIVTTFHPKDSLKRKFHRIIIDVLVDDGLYGIEIVNIKNKVVESKTVLNEFIIDQVVPNSPAFKANLKKDDRIIEINGHNVSKMEISEIQFLIKESKRSYDGKLDILVGKNLLNFFLK